VGVGPVSMRAPRYGLEPLDSALDGLWPGDNVVWLVDDAASRSVDSLLASVMTAADCTDMDASSFERAVFDLRSSEAAVGAIVEAAASVLRKGRIAVWICTRTGAPDELMELAQVVVDLTESRLRIDRADGRRSRVRGMEMAYAMHDGIAELGPPSTVPRLGEALRAIRKQRGWSQADLGAMIGVSGSAISQTERGQQSMSLDTVIDLADRLGVSLDRLVRGVNRPFQLIRTPVSGFGFGSGAGPNARNAQCVRVRGRSTISMLSDSVGPQMILVGSGVVRVNFVGDTIVLRQGDIVTTTASNPIGCHNVSEATAVLFLLDMTNAGDALR
jgi:transcriptional regulator with XRE-family HTH domain